MAVVLGAACRLRAARKRAPGDKADAAGDRLDTVAAWPPKATRILTTAERQAYATLVRALPDYVVLAQVPLARFLKVPTRNSYAEWLRRLGSQCADLVVCDNATEVIAVVTVQLPTAEPSERAQKRQARMARVLKAADIPLHVWTSTACLRRKPRASCCSPAWPPPRSRPKPAHRRPRRLRLPLRCRRQAPSTRWSATRRWTSASR